MPGYPMVAVARQMPKKKRKKQPSTTSLSLVSAKAASRMLGKGGKAARNKLYNVKFRNQLPYIENQNSTVTGDPADIPLHFSVVANSLPNWAGYSRIYQQYRIVAIKIDFIPCVGTRVLQNVGTTTTPVEQFRPLLISYVNRASQNFIQNVNQGISVPYAKMHNAGTRFSRYFKCATYDQAYRPLPATTNAQNVEYKQWFGTTTSSDVPHEGLDVVFGAATAMPPGFYKYRPIVTTYVQFKGRQMVGALPPGP